MKVLKLATFALAIGFFAASCNDSTTSDENTAPETEMMDDNMATPPVEEAQPVDTDVMDVDTPATTAPVQ